MKQSDESIYYRLYSASAKLRALSFFLENGLMEEHTVPIDVDQIKLGTGLLLKELSCELRSLGQAVELLLDGPDSDSCSLDKTNGKEDRNREITSHVSEHR